DEGARPEQRARDTGAAVPDRHGRRLTRGLAASNALNADRPQYCYSVVTHSSCTSHRWRVKYRLAMTLTYRTTHLFRRIALGIGVAVLAATFASAAEAALTFTAVAAGDATNTRITLWARAVDPAAPGNAVLSVDIATDQQFANVVRHIAPACTADSNKDFTCKLDVNGLQPNTVYFYRFVGPANELSNTGRFKTAPDASAKTHLHFAFSGDN